MCGPWWSVGIEEIERAGRLPDDIVEAMRGARLFSMLVEERLGGLGLDMPTALRVVEDLATLSASVAWVLAVGAGAAYWATALVDDEVAARIHPTANPSVITSTPGPEGRAIEEAGGWRVTGRWAFASGSAHSDWVAVGCRLADADGPLIGDGRHRPLLLVPDPRRPGAYRGHLARHWSSGHRQQPSLDPCRGRHRRSRVDVVQPPPRSAPPAGSALRLHRTRPFDDPRRFGRDRAGRRRGRRGDLWRQEGSVRGTVDGDEPLRPVQPRPGRGQGRCGRLPPPFRHR